MEQTVVDWVPDEISPHCMNCGLKFGLESALNLTGRHHCRLCGVSVCRDCCHSMLYVGLAEIVNHEGNFNADDAVRVCEYCIADVIKLKVILYSQLFDGLTLIKGKIRAKRNGHGANLIIFSLLQK